MYVKISGPNTEIYNTFTPRDLNDIGVYTFLPAPQRTFQSGLLLQPGKVVHREETRRLACLGAEPRVLPAMTRHHRRSRTVRTVPYHHRFAPAAVTQGGSHVELCTSPLRSHGTCQYGRLRRPRGGAEGLYGRRWPNPAGAESYHVRWGRALGHSGFVARLRRTPDHLNATISRICLITALSSHPTAQKVRATA